MSAQLNTNAGMRPVWQHNCPKCRFLGNFHDRDDVGVSDLWFCQASGNQPLNSALIARHGDEAIDYMSIDVSTALTNCREPAMLGIYPNFTSRNAMWLLAINVAIRAGYLEERVLRGDSADSVSIAGFKAFAARRGMSLQPSKPEHRVDREFVSMRTQDAWLVWKELR